MRVADRFGDFGLTGVAILERQGEAWHLESFLMSCRVIGKSVETALLARLAEDARAAGATTLSAEFVDSGRNQVAAKFLAQPWVHARSGGPLGPVARRRRVRVAGMDLGGRAPRERRP